MFKFLRDHMNYSVWYLLLTASIGLVLSLVGCNRQAPAPVQSGPMTFASPEDAGKSLEEAAKSQNLDQVLNIFGPGSKETISSGDARGQVCAQRIRQGVPSHEPLEEAKRWHRTAPRGRGQSGVSNPANEELLWPMVLRCCLGERRITIALDREQRDKRDRRQ